MPTCCVMEALTQPGERNEKRIHQRVLVTNQAWINELSLNLQLQTHQMQPGFTALLHSAENGVVGHTIAVF